MRRPTVLALVIGLVSGCASCPPHPWLSRFFGRECPPVVEVSPTTSLLVPAPGTPDVPLPAPRITETMPSPRLAPEQPAPPNHRP
ncbi:MAG: hypothetical protein RMI91_10100 [Gemmatales bacterium]|nr:hypothetical protein [Gemmatales bacterium]MDW7994993.1 hypothetical protein [Gemmatales bacterium]